MQNQKRKHCVYKYVLDGEIIYIGLADADLDKRLAQHGKPGDNIDAKYWNDLNQAEIYYVSLANSVMADVVEKELIRRYKPVCNKAYSESKWNGLPFQEPEWILYQLPEKQKTEKRLNTQERRWLRKLAEYDYIACQNTIAVETIKYWRVALRQAAYCGARQTTLGIPGSIKDVSIETIFPRVCAITTKGGYACINSPGCLKVNKNSALLEIDDIQQALEQITEMLELANLHKSERKKFEKELKTRGLV